MKNCKIQREIKCRFYLFYLIYILVFSFKIKESCIPWYFNKYFSNYPVLYSQATHWYLKTLENN